MDERFLIGIILDSTNVKICNAVKEAFVQVVNKDGIKHDLVYFYEAGVDKVPNRLSKTGSALLMSKPTKIKIYDALDFTFKVINNELTDDFQRCVVVITDNYKEKDELSCSLVLRQQHEASYIFFGIGDYHESLKKLGEVINVDNIDDLKMKIINFFDKLVEERNG